MVDDIQNSSDTASVFDALGKNSNKKTDSDASGNSDLKSGRERTIGHLNREIEGASDYIKDLETLVIAKVLHKIHIAYYRAWTNDLRHAYSLICRLNRRKTEIGAKLAGKLDQKVQTG